MGVSFVNRVSNVHSIEPLVTIKAYLGAKRLLEARNLRRKLSSYDSCIHAKFYIESLQTINTGLTETIAWLVSYHDLHQPLASVVEFYAGSYRRMIEKEILRLYPGTEELMERQIDRNRTIGLDDFAARSLAVFPDLLDVLGVLWSSKKSGSTIEVASDAYANLSKQLDIDSVLMRQDSIEPSSSWESELLYSSINEIRRCTVHLVVDLLKQGKSSVDVIENAITQNPELSQLRTLISDSRTETLSVAQVAVISQRLHSVLLRCLGKAESHRSGQ